MQAYSWAKAFGSPTYSLAVNGLAQNEYGSASRAGYSLVSELIAEILFLLIRVCRSRLTGEKVPKEFGGRSIGLTLVLI